MKQARRRHFHERTRREQKAIWLEYRTRIRTSAPRLGARFYSFVVMDDATQEADLVFLGRRTPVLYNVSIETAKNAYAYALSVAAAAAADVLVPPAPFGIEAYLVAIPGSSSRLYKPSPEVLAARDATHVEFGGRTRSEWTRGEQERLANAGDVVVFEGWRLSHDYAVGTGLEVVLDVPNITVDVVHALMDRFFETEADWRSDVPRTYPWAEVVGSMVRGG